MSYQDDLVESLYGQIDTLTLEVDALKQCIKELHCELREAYQQGRYDEQDYNREDY